MENIPQLNEPIHPLIWANLPTTWADAKNQMMGHGFSIIDADSAYEDAQQLIAKYYVDEDDKEGGEIALSIARLLLWAAACNNSMTVAKKAYIAELKTHATSLRRNMMASDGAVDENIHFFTVLLDAWEKSGGDVGRGRITQQAHKLVLNGNRDQVTRQMLEMLDFDNSDSDSDSDIHITPIAQERPACEGSHKVIREIGDAESADGRGIHKRYSRVLNKPLPLSCSMPEKGHLLSTLEAEFPWAKGVVSAIENAIDLQRSLGIHVPNLKPILLIGEPGTGKTTLALRIAEFLNLRSTILAVGGTSDAAALAAVTRGWSGSRPCAPFLAMHRHHVADPCMIVDELDKGGAVGGQNGSATGTLLSMLSSSEAYFDTCLLADIDLSHVFWIATANSLDNVPPALVDRFQVFVVPRPESEHFGTLTKSMRAKLARELNTIPEFLPSMDADEFNALKSFFYENRGSLRQFDRVFRFIIGEALKREQSIPRSALS